MQTYHQPKISLTENHFQTLGIKIDVDIIEDRIQIGTQFNKRVMESIDLTEIKKIEAAYEVLSDPKKLKKYKSELYETLSDIKPNASYYEILGIPLSANETQIKNAWARLSIKLVSRQRTTDEIADSINDWIARTNFKKIAEACKTLLDPTAKKEYDEKLGNESLNDNGKRLNSLSNGEITIPFKKQKANLQSKEIISAELTQPYTVTSVVNSTREEQIPRSSFFSTTNLSDLPSPQTTAAVRNTEVKRWLLTRIGEKERSARVADIVQDCYAKFKLSIDEIHNHLVELQYSNDIRCFDSMSQEKTQLKDEYTIQLKSIYASLQPALNPMTNAHDHHGNMHYFSPASNLAADEPEPNIANIAPQNVASYFALKQSQNTNTETIKTWLLDRIAELNRDDSKPTVENLKWECFRKFTKQFPYLTVNIIGRELKMLRNNGQIVCYNSRGEITTTLLHVNTLMIAPQPNETNYLERKNEVQSP